MKNTTASLVSNPIVSTFPYPRSISILHRGILTVTYLILWTKLDFNVIHLVNLFNKFRQKLQIHGSGDLLNLVLLLGRAAGLNFRTSAA